ncbi:MAG TPA: transcription termination factor NusA [Anaerolineales bacterium]|nr:transcription termination factor NusA [Anaerolineales bacterium]
MKSEFTLAFNEITERFGLTRETVMEALEAAMVSAYRRSVSASSAQSVEARLDPETGEVHVFAEKEVVESVENLQTEVALDDARKYDANTELGALVLVESTPKDFGRVAAQTAKQVVLQRLREAERDAQYEEFVEREGDMVHGTVHSITPQAVTIGLGRAEAVLPRNQQIPGEHFKIRDRIRVYVLEVRKSSRGPVIVVSRTHPHMLRRLLETEVPEIHQGLVEIKAIAREAGKRAKVAVAALREGIDPVGACVGLRGVRIQSIVRDLNDEKIDVIEWNSEPAIFTAKALSPARVSGVFLDEDPERGKTALVVVPEDQLSLAIGRAGVNARLAAKLTGWRIDIKSLTESASESLKRLQTDPLLADLAESEAEVIAQVETILAKKAENRPVAPEGYQVLTGFVDRVQRAVQALRTAKRREQAEKLAQARATIPTTAYSVPLEQIGLSTRVLGLLTEAGHTLAGHLAEQIALDEDKILAIPGIGPKAMEELKEALRSFPYPEPAPVEAPIPAPTEEVLVEPSIALDALAALPGAIPQPVEQPAEAPEGAISVAEQAPIGVGEPAPALEAAPPSEEALAVPVEVGEAGVAVTAEALEAAPVESVEKVFEAVAEQLATVVGDVEVEDEEEEATAAGKGKKPAKKAKKPGKWVELDEASGATVVHRLRKPGRSDDPEEYNY